MDDEHTDLAQAQLFRKKPVIIEAVRFNAYTDALPSGHLYKWLENGGCSFALDQTDPGPVHLLIFTLEGWMRADIGDWIIKGVAGEFYPCKPDIFTRTYEEANRE